MRPAGCETADYINRIIELLDRQPGITILEIMHNIDPDNWQNNFKQIREAIDHLIESGRIYLMFERKWTPSRYYPMK